MHPPCCEDCAPGAAKAPAAPAGEQPEATDWNCDADTIGPDACTCRRCLMDQVSALRFERDRLATALAKISEIRNSIIGCQTVNWSEHVYPLVAALDAAGLKGEPYPAARERLGTLLERTSVSERRAEAAEERARGAEARLKETARCLVTLTAMGNEEAIDMLTQIRARAAQDEEVDRG
jgi:hypothetical protein